MPFVSVKNVNVEINGQTIVKDISFSVEKGEIVSIIGPNGSGKTTLLKAMLGLIEHSGEILLENQPLEKNLGRVGYVPQRFNFDITFPITVREFLNLASPHSKLKVEKEICRDIKINQFQNKKLGQLSGGQLQRVLIAQSLIREPELLILDEPTAGIDIEGSKNFYEIVEHLNKKHKATIIMVSHEVNMVYKLADKVICLNREMICYGQPNESLNKATLDKLYSKMEMRPHRH